MALTPEDLQAIAGLTRAVVREEIESISKRLNTLELNQQAMQEHITSLASDVSYLNHTIEPKLDKVLEMVSSANDRNQQLNLVTNKVEIHEHRLFAVEEVLRKAE